MPDRRDTTDTSTDRSIDTDVQDGDRSRDGARSPSAERGVSGARLELRDVTKRYPGQKQAAVDSLTIDIPAGETVMFVGPSGCGKTTSLKMINRLIEPSSGTITIDGRDIREQNADELRRNIGYVIQGGSLFPHMTVAQNIGIVPGLLKWDKKRTASRVEELLDLVGLDPARYHDRYPRELSGGQQQRVGVARGLAADPPVILMDEPFGAVDPITRQRLQDELLSIQDELHKTIVCVTHDIDEALKLGDRILILREGAQIEQYDTPEAILAAPATDFVADFVGAGSRLKALSLARVRDLPMRDWTTATVGESSAAAAARARAAGDDSVVVLDDRRRPHDWLWLRSLRADKVAVVAQDLVTVDERATLNDALDVMLSSTQGGVVVTGARDEYLGVLNFETVTEHVRQMQADVQESTDEQQSGLVEETS